LKFHLRQTQRSRVIDHRHNAKAISGQASPHIAELMVHCERLKFTPQKPKQFSMASSCCGGERHMARTPLSARSTRCIKHHRQKIEADAGSG
jgi:hypothetical protein